jgi:transposase
MKRSSVATDILGRSGRAMLDALVADDTDAAALAQLAKGACGPRSPSCSVP